MCATTSTARIEEQGSGTDRRRRHGGSEKINRRAMTRPGRHRPISLERTGNEGPAQQGPGLSRRGGQRRLAGWVDRRVGKTRFDARNEIGSVDEIARKTEVLDIEHP
jgi:hypothetical protein